MMKLPASLVSRIVLVAFLVCRVLLQCHLVGLWLFSFAVFPVAVVYVERFGRLFNVSVLDL